MREHWTPPESFRCDDNQFKRGDSLGTGGSGDVYDCERGSKEELVVKFFTTRGCERRLAPSIRMGTVSEQQKLEISEPEYETFLRGQARSDFENERTFLTTIQADWKPRIICSGATLDGTETPFIVMSKAQGSHLDRWLKTCTTWVELCQVLQNVARALQELSELECLHLDFKSSNIVINSDTSKVQIIDFALSMSVAESADHQQYLLIPNGRVSWMDNTIKRTVNGLRHSKHKISDIRKTIFPWFDLCNLAHELKGHEGTLENICGRSRAIRFIGLMKSIERRELLRPSQFNSQLLELGQEPRLFPSTSFRNDRSLQIGDQPVVLTTDAERVLDTKTFARLHLVKQLGLVDLVFRGATHSRWLHSLDVYRQSICLQEALLAKEDRLYLEIWSPQLGALSSLVALLHDVNHIHFLHLIQEMDLWQDSSDSDEGWTLKIVNHLWRHSGQSASIQSVLTPICITKRLFMGLAYSKKPVRSRVYKQSQQSFVRSLINSGADIDKMSYLILDGLYTGVPYGKCVDASHLHTYATVCQVKGNYVLGYEPAAITALEALVTARYWNFKTIYWHHTHRALMAMLLHTLHFSFKTIDELHRFLLDCWHVGQREFLQRLEQKFIETTDYPNAPISGVELERSRLFRRLITLHYRTDREKVIIDKILNKYRSYKDRVTLMERFAVLLSEASELGQILKCREHHLVLDLVNRDVIVEQEIWIADGSRVPKALSEVSDVVRHVSEEFRVLSSTVRIFLSPDAIVGSWSNAERSRYRSLVMKSLETCLEDAKYTD